MEVIKFIKKGIIFGIVGLIILVIITPIFVPKWYDDSEGTKYSGISRRIKGMYKEPKDTIDVVMIGNSNMYNGISTMRLWGDNGISSYHIGTPQQNTWTGYYLLKDFYKTQSPEVAVIDVDFVFEEKVRSQYCLSQAIDCMPFSLNKLKMISDPIYKSSFKKKISYVFPFLRYHSRWNEVNNSEIKSSYKEQDVPFKGYDLWKKVKGYNKNNKKQKKVVTEIPADSKKYLEKIIDLCKKNNTKVVLIYVPTAKSWSKEKNKLMSDYAQENELKYLDYNFMDFDWDKYTRDGGNHLNIYGAEKVTVELEKVLNEYNLQDHRNEEKYDEWNEDYKIYEECKETTNG